MNFTFTPPCGVSGEIFKLGVGEGLIDLFFFKNFIYLVALSISLSEHPGGTYPHLDLFNYFYLSLLFSFALRALNFRFSSALIAF